MSLKFKLSTTSLCNQTRNANLFWRMTYRKSLTTPIPSSTTSLQQNPRKMTTPPNPAQAIAGVIGALQETFEVSTDLTLSDLNRLHEKNQSLAKDYSAMAKAAENLDQDAAELKAKCIDSPKFSSQIVVSNLVKSRRRSREVRKQG